MSSYDTDKRNKFVGVGTVVSVVLFCYMVLKLSMLNYVSYIHILCVVYTHIYLINVSEKCFVLKILFSNLELIICDKFLIFL